MRSRAVMNGKRTVTHGRVFPPSRPSSPLCRSWQIRTWRSASPRNSSNAFFTRIRRLESESPQPSRGRTNNRKLKPNRLAELPFEQNPFHSPQIFFRIHAHRVERGFRHVDCDAVIEEPKL